jgi:hypothetical protein
VASLGYPGIRLDHKVSIPPPPLTVAARPPQPQPPTAPLATATPAELCRLLADLFAGSVVDQASSAQMITTLRYQQDKSLFPRAYLEVAAPEEPPGPQTPAIAHKTGCVSGCRADTGLLHLPEGGGIVAYCAVADRLADQTMSVLAEGDEILGRSARSCSRAGGPGPARLRGRLPPHGPVPGEGH